jgi:hypothetical protein
MDGQMVEDYNSTSSQQQLEQQNYIPEDSTYRPDPFFSSSDVMMEGVENKESEWSQYYDEEGYEYWCSNSTGESTYEVGI